MPLDGPDETLGRHPDRLHDAVRRGGHRFQSLAQRANRLMVIAVDAQRIGARMIRPAEGIDLIGLRLTRAIVSQRPQRAGQRRIGRDRHFVDHRVIRRLVAMMHDRAGMLVRQILPQRASQGDVEALDAAADAQQRLVRRDDRGNQTLLHPVAGLAQFDRLGAGRLAIPFRIHVVAAGDQESVALADQLSDYGLVVGQRQHHRDATSFGDAVEIAGQHPQAVQCVVPQRDHADKRTVGHRYLQTCTY